MRWGVDLASSDCLSTGQPTPKASTWSFPGSFLHSHWGYEPASTAVPAAMDSRWAEGMPLCILGAFYVA